MARQIFAFIRHKDGVVDDSAYEFITAANKISSGALSVAVVTGCGAQLDSVCNEIKSSFSSVWKIDNEALYYPNAEIIRPVLTKMLPGDAIVLFGHDTLGMDLAPGLSIKMDSPFISDVIDFENIEGSELRLIRQEFSGQVCTHVSCDISSGAIINVRPGSFLPDESKSAGGEVIDKSAEAGNLSSKRRFLEIIEAEMGDIDITKSEILVSVGRGIEDEDNIEIAKELAEAIGADVSCSRPIVDAKWMEKGRQVGTSGKTVSPKVYIALGISGSFQHLGGLKGNPFIVAINKNPRAPIFQVADVGVVDDLLDFVPELTETIRKS